MREMIEQVAKAIAECHSGRDWRGMSEHGKDWWRDEARAAIEAMREPTDAMVDAANALDRVAAGVLVTPIPERAWEAMIDAALSFSSGNHKSET